MIQVDETYRALKEVVLARRSVRRFLPDPVPEEDVLEILECARWAPSDTNQQPWRFLVIADRDLIARAEAVCWEEIARLQALAEARGRPDVAKKLRVFGRYATVFAGAPLLILLAAEPYRSRFTEEIFAPLLTPAELAALEREEAVKSVSLAAQNLLLAAHARGYGACAMTGPLLLAERRLAALVELPPGQFLVMAVALGRPAQQPEGPGRRPLAELVTWRR